MHLLVLERQIALRVPRGFPILVIDNPVPLNVQQRFVTEIAVDTTVDRS